MKAIRVRHGVMLDDDGWRVTREIDGNREVYDPPFATEAEAEAKANEAARLWRQVCAERGIRTS